MKLLQTAGPLITEREIQLVNDALRNGWGSKCYDYMYEFEKKFAKYLGVKYAISTSGGTCALELGAMVLGFSEGDEVIVPDMGYYAASDLIVLSGAKPVFVDILPDTWNIDPERVIKAITPKTKAILPIDSYGVPIESDDLNYIAKKYNLTILEDACPAAGSEYGGKKVGTLHDISAFSFQGAKIITTGIGGMLVTNNEDYYKKAMLYNDHGEGKIIHKSDNFKFWQITVGREMWMSNIQAALGVAQLEKLDELVGKHRQIYKWYFQKLESLNKVILCRERPYMRSNMWMVSIILNNGQNRKEIMKKLKMRNIETRPMFYPISMFKMYDEADTPISHQIGLNGINLPSKATLKKEEIDYVCKTIYEIA